MTRSADQPAKRRPGLMFGDPLCECALMKCADHTMSYGKMCSACQSGDHREEGELHTRSWYEGFYGKEPTP